MNELGRAPLGPFAFYIIRPTWIGEEPRPNERSSVAWTGNGIQNVPITALRDGFIIFEFDQSADYAGGAVPAYKLPENRQIPPAVSVAERAREDLAYRRFIYMNAFLLALYSGFSTVQKRGVQVQEPVDPTNYFGVERVRSGWRPYMGLGRKINYPLQRSDDVAIETLDNALQILDKFNAAVGPQSLDVLALIYTACHQYALHQFSSAHLIAWSAIEAMVNVLWQNLQTEIDSNSNGHTKMNKQRRALLNGRDYTVSIVTQILSISQKIDDEMLDRLDMARRKRNEFAHQLSLLKSEDAGKAIRLATDIITTLTGIQVTSQLSLSFWI